MWDQRQLGLVPYEPTWHAMRQFALERTLNQPDALWICEHPPTFTQGLAGRAEHVLAAGDIPVVATDRGGQVTYHGPGQVVAYPLIDLKRAGYFVKEYVFRLEEAALRALADWAVVGHRVRGAPGIYVRLADPHRHARLAAGFASEQLGAPDAPERLGKIAALGIKVARHCTYHGLSLNVAMNLEPFSRINPCGYQGLPTVDLATIGVQATPHDVAMRLAHHLRTLLES
jgi:lipoyl(octanoyl) transferase